MRRCKECASDAAEQAARGVVKECESADCSFTCYPEAIRASRLARRIDLMKICRHTMLLRSRDAETFTILYVAKKHAVERERFASALFSCRDIP